MRYVVVSLGVLLLGVSVGGQEKTFEREAAGAKAAPDSPFLDEGVRASDGPVADSDFFEGLDDFAPAAKPSPFLTGKPRVGLGPSPDPAFSPMSEGQGKMLRDGVAKTRAAVAALAEAAEMFRRGGDQEAANQLLQAVEVANRASGGVEKGLERREAAIASDVAKAEAEVKRLQGELERLKEELRRTREGKPQPQNDFGGPANGFGGPAM